MILIQEIKVIQTDLDPITIASALSCSYEPMRAKNIPPEITTEMIRGRRFVNHQGEEVCIGMSKQVQEAIGLPFEVYDNMQSSISFLEKRCQNLNNENFWLRNRIGFMEERFQSINLWGRIKFVFTRNKGWLQKEK